MGKDLCELNDAAADIFHRADRLVGASLSKLCFEGPEVELTRTVNTQTAIFVTSLAALAALKSISPQLRPSLACGLSLGEFTALVALDSIPFEEGLKLVRRRGELMEEANRLQPGTMASIVGLSIDECKSLCRESGAELANINGYEQIVISGCPDHVNSACSLAKSKGAKLVVSLKVGGAFHSSLMTHARKGLEEALRKVQIRKPQGSFIPNVTGEPEQEPEKIRKLLAEQLTSPVQWVKTMEHIARSGLRELLEIGPGRVLRGLARKINADLKVVNIEKEADLAGFKSKTTDAQKCC